MIRVAIVEDNITYLKAIQLLICEQPDMTLVYSAEDLFDLTALYNTHPDVVILDIDLPMRSGIEGARLIKEKIPLAGVFMLTVFEDEDKIFNSIKAGANGYLLKKDPPDKILDAIKAISKGESMMNGKIARKILDYFNRKEIDQTQVLKEYLLSKREREILNFLIEGKTLSLIADICNISPYTLSTHNRNIYRKLNIHSRAELTAMFNK